MTDNNFNVTRSDVVTPKMKQEDHPDHNMPDSEYEGYILAHERAGDRPVVARSGKSDSLRKDQSRYGDD
jgi:hypothetical protein